MEIQEFAKKLEIPYLLHFTRWENIDGILKDGLCPKILIEDLPYEVTINDEMRLDGHEDSVSVSIAFPNHKMFYRYRKNTGGMGWVILVIAPSVLWEYEAAFCKHNAADSRISRVSSEELKNIASFEGMYEEDKTSESSRSFNKLESYDPTDPQAEVLVFDVIPTEKIVGVIFENCRLKIEFENNYPNIKTCFDPNYYSARCYVRTGCWKPDVSWMCKGAT
jgi:hypothetical protein